MSIAVDYAPCSFGLHTMVDDMDSPLNGWHTDSNAPRNGGYYQRDQHNSQPPRLPSMASIISNATQGHARDSYPGKAAYYTDYATPSPVGQTPPQLPSASSDPHPMSRRPMTDVRLSPAQSSVASDRSDDYQQDIMRMRQAGRDYRQAPGHMQRLYSRQPEPRRDTFHHHEGPPPNFGKLVAGQSTFSSEYTPQPRQTYSPPTSQASSSPRQASMSISNLLSDPSAPTTSTSEYPLRNATHRTDTEYKISVRQQPDAARSCGFGERDRRVIDPPPIIQLTAHNSNLTSDELAALVKSPLSVVHCSIWDEAGMRDMSTMAEDTRTNRRLMGTLVASPFVGLDENGEEGVFFCFPDLSCRTPGTFRLKFQIVIFHDPQRMSVPGMKVPVLSTALSDPFQVFNAKDFPGMKASTPLTKKLKEQGCLISIKKGNEKNIAAQRRDESDDDDEDDDRESRRRKKQRKN